MILISSSSRGSFQTPQIDTEYDRANVPLYNGNDPPPAPGSLKRSLFPTLFNEVQNKGTQGVRARYGAELPPIISIVRCPGRPVISVPNQSLETYALDLLEGDLLEVRLPPRLAMSHSPHGRFRVNPLV